MFRSSKSLSFLAFIENIKNIYILEKNAEKQQKKGKNFQKKKVKIIN